LSDARNDYEYDAKVLRVKPRGAAKKPLRKETSRDKSFLAVADRLFTTLETFTNFPEGELSLDEITRLNGLPKSTCFRLLQSLEKCGFLVQNRETGRYSLGERFFALVNTGLPYQRLISIAKPFLHSLMLTFGESVNLGVFDEGMVAHIFAIDSPKPYRVTATIGNRANLHCTGMGKSIAAYLLPEELEQALLKHGLPARTNRTLTSTESLTEDLATVRQTGVSHDNQEDVEGVECFAAPLFGKDGTLLAAISISGPSVRMGAQAESMRAAVRETARRISRMLGWNPVESVASSKS
jgi:IclR family transcriptional regulator, KDG regulon repressor